MFPRARVAAIHRMATDCEGFDQGELFEGKIARDVQFSCWEQELRAQAAIAMYAEGLVVFTAVGMTAPAGIAFLAVDVGFHRAAVARSNICDVGSHREHLDSEFVAWNSGVRVEGHFAEVTAVIRAADSDAVDSDEGLSEARGGRGCDFDGAEGLRLEELDGLHGGGLVVFWETFLVADVFDGGEDGADLCKEGWVDWGVGPLSPFADVGRVGASGNGGGDVGMGEGELEGELCDVDALRCAVCGGFAGGLFHGFRFFEPGG